MDSCIQDKDCICKDYNSIPKECKDAKTIRDSGKSIKLEPKKGEESIAVIVDNCLIKKGVKCDALFLLKGKINYVVLVELKGFGEIEKAFRQLSKTRENSEYKSIKECFCKDENCKEELFIVTNGILPKHKKERFENDNRVRIKAVLQNSATTTIPNLREYL